MRQNLPQNFCKKGELKISKKLFLMHFFVLKNIIVYASRDVAQLGSALPWGGRGREFKSHRSDQNDEKKRENYLLSRFFLFFLIFFNEV